MAIDILAERKAGEAIPYLIECLADYRGLTGSDNWVGGHAASALSAITGRPFSVDRGRMDELVGARGAGALGSSLLLTQLFSSPDNR